MAQKNSNLNQAKRAKNDEFYTQLTDIEKEMVHYRPHFKGKVIFCNCDDARESNFFKYFANNFELLGIRKLITTGYKENGHGVVLEYEGDKNGNLIVDPSEIKVTELKGNGDFRSDECIEYLRQADIVVTNPPFSLFREYVAQLIEYDKKFLIIGNKNAIKYKEIFPLIKDNRLWVGYTPMSTDLLFDVPAEEAKILLAEKKPGSAYKIVNGVVKGRSQSIWYTNIPHGKRSLPLDLYKTYNDKDFPKYDNYDAIEVSKVCDIPMDYYGVMGVPITFLDKYCPAQFEIVGVANHGSDHKYDLFKPMISNKEVYARILIRRKSADK